VLVDSSALIDHFNGTSCRESDLLDTVLAEGPAPATAGIIVQEFLQGLRAKDAEVARRALADFVRLDPPSYRAHEAADLYWRARGRGLTPATVDTLIVQLALEAGLALLTRDRSQTTLARIAGVPIA
jgi:predicted nucleic acid-binding protein